MPIVRLYDPRAMDCHGHARLVSHRVAAFWAVCASFLEIPAPDIGSTVFPFLARLAFSEHERNVCGVQFAGDVKYQGTEEALSGAQNSLCLLGGCYFWSCAGARRRICDRARRRFRNTSNSGARAGGGRRRRKSSSAVPPDQDRAPRAERTGDTEDDQSGRGHTSTAEGFAAVMASLRFSSRPGSVGRKNTHAGGARRRRLALRAS